MVHEATLNEYEDYQLLSELIREIILRLINSKLERYSSFVDKMFKGESPNLSYNEYIIQKHIKIEDSLFGRIRQTIQILDKAREIIYKEKLN